MPSHATPIEAPSLCDPRLSLEQRLSGDQGVSGAQQKKWRRAWRRSEASLKGRAKRYQWTCDTVFLNDDDDPYIRLRSPTGTVRDCITCDCAHEVLTNAVCDAWAEYTACQALWKMIDDPAHSHHTIATAWLSGISMQMRPWDILRDTGFRVLGTPRDLPSLEAQVLHVESGSGRDMRDAMHQYRPLVIARALAEVTATAVAVRGRTRL